MNKNILGWFFAFNVVVIWGLTGIVSKPLTDIGIYPVKLTFYRSILSILGLYLIIFSSSKNFSIIKELGNNFKIRNGSIFILFFCGIVGQGLFNYFNFLSLKYIGTTENAIVQGMQPFATVLFGVIFFNFKMNVKKWIIFFLTIFIICFIFNTINLGTINHNKSNSYIGYCLVCISMFSLAFTAHMRNYLSKIYGSAISMLYQYIGECFMFSLIIIVMGCDIISDFYVIFCDMKNLSLLLFLGILISGVSYLIQLYSFKYIGVEKSTMTLNLVPLVGYIASVLIFQDFFSCTVTTSVILIVILLYFF